jgi:flavin reductase (DIM6/NTAB) family NADH-FMN oxidoreductase RutF
MFYDAVENSHGLPHDPFKALIAPRPIGWISSISKSGQVNLAPYSFFNGVSTDPNIVMFSSGGHKDSMVNVEETGEFVCSLATYDLRDEMNQTSAALSRGENEMDFAGLEAAPSRLVAPPRVAASPVALECKYIQTVEMPIKSKSGITYHVVFGHVVGIHIDDSVIVDGLVDVTKIRPLARLGYMDYSVVDTVFSLARPQI